MLNFVERYAKPRGNGLFTVTGKDAVEIRLDRRRQRAIVAGPKFRNARFARLRGHFQSVVGLFEIKGIADCVPAASEMCAVLCASWIFENLNARNVLAQKTQAERDAARHAKAPTEAARSVLAEVVVKSRVPAARGQQNPRHEALLL